MRYDLAIVGSGAAGFAAAIAASGSGCSVVMIEQGTVGGTCVNTGCVPSKALLAAADARHVALEQRFPGIATGAGPVDAAALRAATAGLVEGMRADKYVDLAAGYGWPILSGAARFVDGPALEVALTAGGRERVEAEHFLVATGSTPSVPPIPGLAEAGYLTSTTALELTELPASMIVLGGGTIGLELGQLFARLGVQVSIVEALPRLAPVEEPEISAVLDEVLRGEGIVTSVGTAVTAVRRDGSGVTMTGRRDGQPIELHAERLLVATGRRPATTGLNLDAVGVRVGPGGEIEVDAQLRTAHPRIWAAGDVTGGPQFVYLAAAHGALATENALDGANRAVDHRTLPRVTFQTPGIASVGLTEAQATQQGYACDCRVLPLAHVPRAIVDRDTRGLIKLVADTRTGRLLGAHVAAHGAGEVIAAAVYALANQMTVQQMAELWCPYLTMAEGLKLAAQAFTRDISRLSCCAA
jgi:mercuric reductase